jgi:hypothetical protein
MSSINKGYSNLFIRITLTFDTCICYNLVVKGIQNVYQATK